MCEIEIEGCKIKRYLSMFPDAGMKPFMLIRVTNIPFLSASFLVRDRSKHSFLHEISMKNI